MAPEIREGKIYDGKKVDTFALGVIIFIIVQGNFPFIKASPDDFYFKMLKQGQHEAYFKKTGAIYKSEEFKDLMK